LGVLPELIINVKNCFSLILKKKYKLIRDKSQMKYVFSILKEFFKE
jgi:hypothetical protein